MPSNRSLRAVTATALLVLVSCHGRLGGCAAGEPRPAVTDVRPPGGPRIYVSNEDSGDISVIDPATDTVVARIFVGKRPRGLRLSPDGRRLYVAVSGSPKAPPGVDESTLPPPDRSADGIAEVDLATLKLVRTLESGDDPEAFDLSPDGRLLYVSNEDAARASVLDVASGRVLRAMTVGGEPEGVTTRPDGAFVYVTSEQDNLVAVLDAVRHEVVARVPTGPRPRAVAFTPDGAHAFVTQENGASVRVVDARTHTPLGDIHLPGKGARPMGLALSPDGRTLYVTAGRGGQVAFVDVASRSVTRAIEAVGTRPWGIGVSPDGRKLYTANGPSNDVSVIDATTGEVLRRVAVGRSPWGIAVSR